MTKEQEKTRGGLTSNEIEQKYADKKSSSALLSPIIAPSHRRRCNDLDRCRATDKQGSHFLTSPPGHSPRERGERKARRARKRRTIIISGILFFLLLCEHWISTVRPRRVPPAPRTEPQGAALCFAISSACPRASTAAPRGAAPPRTRARWRRGRRQAVKKVKNTARLNLSKLQSLKDRCRLSSRQYQ